MRITRSVSTEIEWALGTRLHACPESEDAQRLRWLLDWTMAERQPVHYEGPGQKLTQLFEWVEQPLPFVRILGVNGSAALPSTHPLASPFEHRRISPQPVGDGRIQAAAGLLGGAMTVHGLSSSYPRGLNPARAHAARHRPAIVPG